MKEVVSWAKQLQVINVMFLLLYDYYVEFANFSVDQEWFLNLQWLSDIVL